MWCPLLDEIYGARKQKGGGRTDACGTPFLRKTSTDLMETVSWSSFALGFSFRSSTAGDSGSVLDREDCKKQRNLCFRSFQRFLFS